MRSNTVTKIWFFGRHWELARTSEKQDSDSELRYSDSEYSDSDSEYSDSDSESEYSDAKRTSDDFLAGDIHLGSDADAPELGLGKDLQEGEVDQCYICGQQFYPGWFESTKKLALDGQ